MNDMNSLYISATTSSLTAYGLYAVPVSSSSVEAPKNLGDANCDGKITIADVIVVKSYLSNNSSALTEAGKLNADVDGNGISKSDADMILKMVVGLA